MVNLNTGLLANLILAKPKLAKEEKISEILLAYGDRNQSEETYLATLKQLKSGLMHDLLTWQMRVQGAEEAQHEYTASSGDSSR